MRGFCAAMLVSSFPAGVASEGSTAKKIIGYYEDWSATPSASVLRHYTHVSYAFLEAESSSCTLDQPDQSKIDLFQSAGCKVLGSVGGASMNKYWKYCTVSSLVSQLKSIVNRYGLDGIDIDYEVDPPEQSYVIELHQRLRAALPGKLLTHAPENNQMVRGGTYWNIIAAVKDVDFISVQYYNDHPDPISNLAGSIQHYSAMVNDLFGGDATKVVFGFCITGCNEYNADKYKAASITKSVMAKFPNNFGGVMNWAINQGDIDGSWSAAVQDAMGPPPSPTPSPTPTPSPSPSDSYKCVSDQCVASAGGVSKATCESLCGSDSYKCLNDQCVASASGVSKAICESICAPDSYKCHDNQCVATAGGLPLATCEALCGSPVV